MKAVIRSIGTPLITVLAYVYLFAFPREASAAVTDGLRLCAAVVLPSLFPYFVLTNCVVSSGIAERVSDRIRFCGRLLNVQNGASALLLGFLGGYPLGAKTLAALAKEDRISNRQASDLLPLVNNGGASLFLSMIGGKLFGSIYIGVMLLCIHILSAVAVSLLFRPVNTTERTERRTRSFSEFRFVSAVHDAAATALTVSAFIVVFAVITNAAAQVLGRKSLAALLLSGALELSGGCHAAVSSSLPESLRAALCSLFAGWGGLCIHAQTAAVLDGIDIRFSRYLTAKAMHGLFAFAMTLFYFSPHRHQCMILLPLLMAFSIFFLCFRKKTGGNSRAHAL